MDPNNRTDGERLPPDVQTLLYHTSYPAAALRHWRDAEYLRSAGKHDSAGYHYGFAAECALKLSMEQRQQDTQPIPHEHIFCPSTRSGTKLPDLRATALRRLRGRRAQGLLVLLKMEDYFRGWAVDMRYSSDGIVTQTTCAAWQDQARRTLRAVGLVL